MIADLRALAYLEYRQTANRIRETLRRPARALLYLGALAYFVVIAVLRARGDAGAAVKAIPEPYASALFFAYLTLLGIMMYGAASGIVGAFSSPADARFLSGSPISQRLVVLWLQMRRSASGIGRMLFTIVVYALIFSGSGTFTGIALAMLGGTIVATASAVPMLKMRASTGARTAQSLAGAVAAVGILPMAILLASLLPGGVSRQTASSMERLGAGFAFNALFNGNPAALWALFAAAAAALLLSYWCGSGLYPDLYASSLRVLRFRERRSKAGAGFRLEHTYERGAAARSTGALFDLLRGPWTLVWKEWLAFARSSSMQRTFYFGLAACAGVGALFGRVVGGSKNEPAEAVALASMAGNALVIFAAMGSAIRLADDVAKPLWWIGRDALWLRLFAWTVGTSWRLALCVAAGIAAWALMLHAYALAAAAIPMAAALTLYLRAVGLVIYSLFPSTIDQRGPLALVRALLTYLLAAPPAIAGLAIALTHPTLIWLALYAAIACSLFETLLLVVFAAKRIAGQGVAFARAEAM